jgi:hypothetical protein
MPTHGSDDPEAGHEILPWAKHTARSTRQNVFRPSKDIIPVTGTTGTSFVLRRPKPQSAAPITGPWSVYPSPPGRDADPEDPGNGWVQVSLNSWLLASDDYSAPEADDRLEVTGLGSPLFLDVDSHARQIIWCDVELPSGESPTASIDSGADWNGGGLDVYPSRFEFDTDDGKPDPDNLAPQTDLYIPLAYTYDITDNPWGDDFNLPGIMLTPTIILVQLVTTHLRLFQDCYQGNTVVDAIPWCGSLPPDFNT